MPTLADINLDTLRPPGHPDDFIVLERPMFKEHWTRESRDEDGAVKCESKLLGKRELMRIADRCNERIADTGDFAPIVINHTKDDGSVDPELIGFSGPYRVGTLGNLNPKATIYGKMWVFKDKQAKLRQYPRLSVEYWCSEDDPGDGYFDPVSLLGATTPELDLGVHYSKIDGSDRRLMRYAKVERFQAAMPGGSNTFVPGMIGDDDEKKQPYSKESADMATLTPADIQQIVAAMVPIVTQQVSEAMAGMKGESQPGGGEMVDGLDGDDLDLDNDPDLDIGDDLDGMGDEDLDAMDADTDLDGDVDAAEGAGDLDLDGDGDNDLPEIDDEDSDLGLGDASDLEDTDLPAGDVADDDDEDLEASGKDEGKGKMADKKPDDKADKAKKYSREPVAGMTLQQYAKENAQLRERYEKQTVQLRTMQDDLTALKGRIDASENEKKKAVRYSKLNDLRGQGFVVDVEQELTDTEPLNDDQFARHCTKIVERYARAPVGASLYVPPSQKHDGMARDEKVERYAKVAGDVAKDLAARNKKVDYAAIRANVERNDGKYVPESA
jgi:hypothetical protein